MVALGVGVEWLFVCVCVCVSYVCVCVCMCVCCGCLYVLYSGVCMWVPVRVLYLFITGCMYVYVRAYVCVCVRV